jgi:hypothetical protein
VLVKRTVSKVRRDRRSLPARAARISPVLDWPPDRPADSAPAGIAAPASWAKSATVIAVPVGRCRAPGPAGGSEGDQRERATDDSASTSRRDLTTRRPVTPGIRVR